jgi:hypothetical protein
MMAQPVPHQDKKRVKVYELRNNDWFDRGTGFCTAKFATVCLRLSLRVLDYPCLVSCLASRIVVSLLFPTPTGFLVFSLPATFLSTHCSAGMGSAGLDWAEFTLA